MKKYMGKVKLGDKEYVVEIINGERFIDGKTPEEFLETCSLEQKRRFLKVGCMALNDEIKGITPPKKKYAYYSNNDE